MRAPAARSNTRSKPAPVRRAWTLSLPLLLPNSMRAACLLALALLTALQAWALLRAPAAWLPAAITVTLAPGETLALGRQELAAPQAERAHVALRRDADGRWLIRKLGSAGVTVQRDGQDQRMGSAPLQAGQRFQVGGAAFAVGAADAHSIAFTRKDGQWRYDGATLYRDGAAQPACADAGVATRLAALWNRAMPRALTLARPLAFGGNVHCGNRLGLAGIAPGAALLARGDGRLQLSAGGADGERAPLFVTSSGTGRMIDLQQEERRLVGVSALTVGATRFQLTQHDGSLVLTPARRIALYGAPEQRLPPQVQWQWRQRGLWDWQAAWPLWLGVAVAIAALAAPSLAAQAARRMGRTPWLAAGTQAPAAVRPTRHTLAGVWIAAAALCITGLAALLLQRVGHNPSAACSLLLGATALALWLALPGTVPLATAASLVLLAVGLLAQLDLGLGAPEASWLRFYQKSAALLACGSGAAALWRLWSAGRTAPFSQRGTEWLLAALAGVALAALAAQVLWGDETGVFDLQPVELAKLALTALTAHCLALRMDWHAEPAGVRGGQPWGARWLRLIAPALLFLALLGLALIQVDDYSPLILLLVWSMAMALAYAAATRHVWLAAALLGAGLLAVAAIALARDAGADQLASWPLAGSFYGDRFQVWLAPAVHPHTGQQWLLGARAIADGGWWGADGLLGLRALGLSAGAALAIPAVQDDFAPAFFLYRHGLVGALLLWAVQAAFLAGLLRLAAQAHGAARAGGDFRQARRARFHYFALCGGAAFVLAHLLLSWGTNLAIFPIMGQPMSFLSAGGSHLLFFLCPLLAFCAVSASSFEENPPCRSMSNTKS